MIDTMLVMAAVAAACAVPGVFLVLRKMVLVGDAMSHVLLLGIVLAYFVVRDPASPALFVGAAATGVLTVALVESLQRTRFLKEDAAIGLVFPALFSVGTLLASLYLRNTHLDVDRVLLGSAELAYLDRFTIAGRDIGPRGFAVPAIVCLALSTAIALAYKELKLATFDAGLAATLGFRPTLVHYAFMFGVSLTAVAAFDAVGPVLVLAFFAVPPATARLLTHRLARLLALSVGVAVVAALLGTWLAFQLDLTTAGTVCAVLGAIFAVALVAAPERGLVVESIRKRKLIRDLHGALLVVHLLRHEGTPAEEDESRRDGLERHLNWSREKTERVARRALADGWIVAVGDCWKLTALGRERAKSVGSGA